MAAMNGRPPGSAMHGIYPVYTCMGEGDETGGLCLSSSLSTSFHSVSKELSLEALDFQTLKITFPPVKHARTPGRSPGRVLPEAVHVLEVIGHRRNHKTGCRSRLSWFSVAFLGGRSVSG